MLLALREAIRVLGGLLVRVYFINKLCILYPLFASALALSTSVLRQHYLLISSAAPLDY